MPDPTTILLTVVTLTILIPAAFLLAFLYAMGRRRRGLPIGPRLAGLLAILGGLSFGIFLLTAADDIVVAGPILGGAFLLAYGLWRRRRRVQAGQIVLGTALPWTVLWAFYAIEGARFPGQVDTPAVLTWLSLGITGLVVGGALIRRGDPPPPEATSAAAAGDPGSRSFGNISVAIRDAARIGPFGTSELATIVAFVASWVIVPLVVGSAGQPPIVGFVIAVVVSAVAGTEAYIRAMPYRSRRAFEAFSWLGEWELAEARKVGSGMIPTSREGAAGWLLAHPETADNRWLRIEVLLLGGRFDEARATAERLPSDTPQERWVRAQALDDVDWRAGGAGNLDAVRAAASELQPRDGDERLRAEVSIALSEVRRRMADGRSTPGDALDPLLEVRMRLGRRADGQVGRALRVRLLVTMLVIGAAVGGLFWLINPLAGRIG